MWIILKQQHGRKRKTLVIIHVDYLETAAWQKKEDVNGNN
jgi:hypothetical protein